MSEQRSSFVAELGESFDPCVSKAGTCVARSSAQIIVIGLTDTEPVTFPRPPRKTSMTR